ncbi:MAG: DUF3536 domain-containing protein [Prochlorothrix sp.]|nr:DUF3536 domain-containing protein [Prochlorothrix sp.]
MPSPPSLVPFSTALDMTAPEATPHRPAPIVPQSSPSPPSVERSSVGSPATASASTPSTQPAPAQPAPDQPAPASPRQLQPNPIQAHATPSPRPPTSPPPAAAASPQPRERTPHPSQTTLVDPLKTARGVYLTVHGHFYQPPRESPYLDSIERQAGAEPFHNWNERIYWECYRPNAFARILGDRGEVVEILNNFEYLSFNVGPTLMNWLKRYDSEVYQRILAGDRASCDRLQGHGNAIAQVYNHMILPLANPRDKLTQIRWGKADFKQHFGREPEGMWLAETAVDYETLEALVAEGIRFIILAPSQALRCRPLPSATHRAPIWSTVSGSQIDPTRPYRCFLRGQHPTTASSTLEAPWETDASHEFASQSSSSVPYIDIFFYDGPISRDMGFADLLSNAQRWGERLNTAIKGDQRPAQLISMATDGETFGHHRKGAEKCLAYAFSQVFPQRGWTVTNFAHYLSLQPPTWEVELKPVTAWSCSHGVDRWQRNCGCGQEGETQQHWRKPLRESLDWLRDQLAQIYERWGSHLLRDPWGARDAYGEVLGDRHPDRVFAFLEHQQLVPLSPDERVCVLQLLEMQRHALLMYTSCGWFFEEISRPEGVQILCYAARALELAEELTGLTLEAEFCQRLALAPSNSPQWPTGAEVYTQFVRPRQIKLEQIAAHYGIRSLLKESTRVSETIEHSPSLSAPTVLALLSPDRLHDPWISQSQLYCYGTQVEDYHLQRLGNVTLAVGQLRLVSAMTWEEGHFVFAVLHLGGWDFHCCVEAFPGKRVYSHFKQEIFQALQSGSAAQTVLQMHQLLTAPHTYSLQNLLGEERQRIMRHLTRETLERLNQLYSQVYRSNYGVLMAFHRDRLPVPQELQAAAEIALGYRIQQVLERWTLDGSRDNAQRYVTELEDLALEVQQFRCQLALADVQQMLDRVVYQTLAQLLAAPDRLDRSRAEPLWQLLQRILTVADRLGFNLALASAQELLYAQSCQGFPANLEEYRQDLSHLFHIML